MSSTLDYLCSMKELISSIRDFNRFYVNLIGVFKSRALDLNYSLTDSRIIFEISSHEGCTARELRDLLTIDEGYLSRLITQLVKTGVVNRLQSDDDKRNHNLFLSENGKVILKEINEQSDLQIEKLLANLPQQNKIRVVELMQELKTILDPTKV